MIESEYSAQLHQKEIILLKSLAPFFQGPLGQTYSSKTEGFRNKVKLIVTGTKDNPILGLWGEDDLDAGREILNCPLHHPKLNELMGALPEFIKLCRLEPYQIASRTGELKGLIAFISNDTNEMYLRFVLRSKESLDRIKKNISSLQQILPNLQCVSTNIQPVAHAILEGEEEVFLTEKIFVNHKLGRVKFQIGPRAFVQTNQLVATALYQTASEWVQELKVARFCELFCGQGAFSFFVAPHVKAALGIEVNLEAVLNAKMTAKREGLEHLDFKCSDAALVEKEISEFKADLLLVNPPRRGLGLSLELIQKSKSPYILYSSCSYQTLTRDLEKLSQNYSVQKVQIFDMFPHTDHFETLVLLKLKF